MADEVKFENKRRCFKKRNSHVSEAAKSDIRYQDMFKLMQERLRKGTI